MCHMTCHMTPSNQKLLCLEKKGRDVYNFFLDCDSVDPMELKYNYLLREEVSVLKYAFFAFWGEFFDDN